MGTLWHETAAPHRPFRASRACACTRAPGCATFRGSVVTWRSIWTYSRSRLTGWVPPRSWYRDGGQARGRTPQRRHRLHYM